MDQLAHSQQEAETEEMHKMYVMQHSPKRWRKWQHSYIDMWYFRELQQEYANVHFSLWHWNTQGPSVSREWALYPLKTGALVEVFTFSIFLTLLNLNKGNVNGDTLCYRSPHEHGGTEMQFDQHENKTFPLLRVWSNPVSCRSDQYSVLCGIWSVLLKAWGRFEQFDSNISQK